MTGPDGRRGRRRPVDFWLPRIALGILPVAWIALVVTLPKPSDRDLTIDVSCTSGNPAVAVWVESQSGGSGYAQPGEPGHAQVSRFTFQQKFSGRYQIHVGCGGTQNQWGIPVWSAFGDQPYRRLVCADADAADASAKGCSDQPAG